MSGRRRPHRRAAAARADQTAAALTALQDMATRPGRPVPHRAVLEAWVGHSLADVRVHDEATVIAALEVLGAEAAVLGRSLFLRRPDPGLDVLLHEAVHLVQARSAPSQLHVGTTSVIGPAHPAEREAEALASPERAGSAQTDADTPSAETDAPAGHDDAAVDRRPPAVVARIDHGAVALRRAALAAHARPTAAHDATEAETASTGASPTEPIPAAGPEAADARASFAGASRRATPSGRATSSPPTSGGPASSTAGPLTDTSTGTAPIAAAANGPTLAPPSPVAAGGVAPPDAARQVADQAANAAIDAASTPTAVLHAFTAAPPSVKAQRAASVEQRIGAAASTEESTFQSSLPELTARLDAQVEPIAPARVTAPAAVTAAALEPVALPPTPEPTVEPTADLGRAGANPTLATALSSLVTAAPEDRARQLGARLGDVQTVDPDLSASPGPAPTVPLAGESDPARLDRQGGAATTQAADACRTAQSAVVDGPGPEQIQPMALAEPHRLTDLAVPAVAPVELPEGPARFVALDLPDDVQAAFDRQQQTTMAASLADAIGQAEQAAAERDRQRHDALEGAQSRLDTLNAEADTEQRTQVTAARTTVQTARQQTLDNQAAAVDALDTDVRGRAATERTAIAERTQADEAQIRTRYEGAQHEAEGEIRRGEAEAEAERARAEREAEDQSWWDRAVDFVRSALDALRDAINAVFDAVRAAVNRVLDAVKSFAIGLIEAATRFVNAAIAAFGELVKGLVDTLLGQVFPELAARLNVAIDTAVAGAQAAVQAVASRLTAAVSALVEGLRAGLNGILDAYQAAVNLAVAALGAALTGDWAALARMALEAVLSALGIDPAEFFAFIGRAEATFQAIVDDPGRFLSNLVDAVIGGVRRFADNLLTHLQAGIIGWLTGALGGAGITLPASFDLLGVLSIVQQLLGLTWDRLRERAVRLVGERAVGVLEHLAGYVQTLATQGWSALFEQVRGDLSSLVDTVLGGIRSYLVDRVLMNAITYLASLFSPVGALVQLVLTAWNVYTFLRDQLARLAQVVRTIVDALAQIVAGVIQPASEAVEGVLGRLLPLALDFLARLLRLGDVGDRVRQVITGVRETVEGAIDRLLQRVLAAFRGGSGRDTPTAAPGETGTPHPDGAATAPGGVRAAVTDALLAELSADHNLPEVRRIVAGVARRFAPQGVRRVEVGAAGPDGEYPILVEASPFLPAVLMKLARRGYSVRMATTVHFAQQETLENARSFQPTRAAFPGRRGQAVQAASAEGGAVQIAHDTAGPRTQTAPPSPQRLTSDAVQVTSTNFGDRREGSNRTHAESHFINWFHSDISPASRRQIVGIDITLSHSPCSLCARQGTSNLVDFLGEVRRGAHAGSGLVARLAYQRPHTRDFATTTGDIGALQSAHWSVSGPAITLTEEAAGRESRFAVRA